jgi:hypothetical protein
VAQQVAEPISHQQVAAQMYQQHNWVIGNAGYPQQHHDVRQKVPTRAASMVRGSEYSPTLDHRPKVLVSSGGAQRDTPTRVEVAAIDKRQ